MAGLRELVERVREARERADLTEGDTGQEWLDRIGQMQDAERAACTWLLAHPEAVEAAPRLMAVVEAARDARDVWYATDRERSIDAPEREEMYALCRALDAMKEVPRG